MRRGQRRADRFRRISISRAVTKRPCGSVVGRLLDTFDKDASGVSALQHSGTASVAFNRRGGGGKVTQHASLWGYSLPSPIVLPVFGLTKCIPPHARQLMLS